jgi:hypothetical protein
MPNTATRPAANSIASGTPSNLRHISATNGASRSVRTKSLPLATTRDKELRSRIPSHGIRRLLQFGRRKIRGIDAVAMLTLYSQQFMTCGQEMDFSGSLKELLGDRRGCLNHMLAIIEDDEELSRTDEIDEFQACIVRFQRKPHRRCDGPNDKIRISNASQVDEIDCSAKLRGEGVAGSHGNGGLPDAAWAKKGDESLLANALLHFAKNEVTPNHSAGARRQATLVMTVRTIGFTIFRSNHRSDKRIAPALDVRDVPVSEFAVPKRFSDRGNVDAEAPFIDHHIRPDVINELFLCHDLAGTLSKIDQNVERPAAKGKDDTIALKDPLAARKLERAKLQLSVNAIACHGFQRGFLFSQYPPDRDETEVRALWSILACCGSRVQLHHQGSPGDWPTSLSQTIPTLPSREL